MKDQFSLSHYVTSPTKVSLAYSFLEFFYGYANT